MSLRTGGRVTDNARNRATARLMTTVALGFPLVAVLAGSDVVGLFLASVVSVACLASAFIVAGDDDLDRSAARRDG